ncbi:hypothetical protein C8T65DRAFT_636197 [Cerioporus squamosus]|nr:hypothetical protein C8T65DRAFT_636197 [Cerioporus squamosus]
MCGPHVVKYLRHGGRYVERVLAQSRAMASLVKMMTSGCSTGDVPSWPPEPRQVIGRSERAVSKAIPMSQQVTYPVIRRTSPATDSEKVYSGSFVGSDGLVWPLPPRECMASPNDDFLCAVRPGLQRNETSKQVVASSTTEIDHQPTPGSVGRDGMKWLLPPRKCNGSAWGGRRVLGCAGPDTNEIRV